MFAPQCLVVYHAQRSAGSRRNSLELLTITITVASKRHKMFRLELYFVKMKIKTHEKKLKFMSTTFFSTPASSYELPGLCVLLVTISLLFFLIDSNPTY